MSADCLKMWSLLVLMQFAVFALIECQHNCIDDLYYHIKYYKLKKCYKSETGGITARGNFGSVEACMQFAREKKGLALNYSPRDETIHKQPILNCQVLGCPETSAINVNLLNDTAFDYYSAFGNLSVLEGATCVKSLGVFKLFGAKENYSTAIDNCQKLGGDLAHILTETRTNSLSNIVATAITDDWYKAAYVGLSDVRTEGLYETPLGEPITCYKFRAWSPGHPRNIIRSDDCVIVDSDKSWKVVNCKNKLPYLCEFYSMDGKLDAQTILDDNAKKYADVVCSDIDDSGERKDCKVSQKKKINKSSKNRCLN